MTEANPRKGDEFDARVTDLVVRLVLLGLFLYLSFTLIRPFLPILVWALVLAVALAPLHDWLEARIGGRRRLAAALLTICLFGVVIGPVAALAASLVDTVQMLAARLHEGRLHLPPLPARVESLPVIGEKLHDLWATALSNFEALMLRHRGTLGPLGARFFGFISNVGLDLVKFMVSIALAGCLLAPAPGLVVWGNSAASRIFAPRGEQFIQIATMTIRNVSRGVVGVALLQTILISLVLQAAGVSGAGLLAFLILILCIIQIGPALVVLPVLVWAWLTMPTAQALLLTVVLVPLTVMDNVLKPLLMGRGLATPTVVIFLGLIGGTLAFGLIGLFLGPVVLAVFHDLLRTWIFYPDMPDA